MMFLKFKLLLLLLYSTRALAQAPVEVDQEVITQISGLIRWEGVFYSIFLILVIATGLRFVHGFVDGLSEKFVQRRLILQDCFLKKSVLEGLKGLQTLFKEL